MRLLRSQFVAMKADKRKPALAGLLMYLATTIGLAGTLAKSGYPPEGANSTGPPLIKLQARR